MYVIWCKRFFRHGGAAGPSGRRDEVTRQARKKSRAGRVKGGGMDERDELLRKIQRDVGTTAAIMQFFLILVILMVLTSVAYVVLRVVQHQQATDAVGLWSPAD